MGTHRQRRPQSILRLKVKGPHIRPGRIPIPELLAICGDAQTAINRRAEALQGGKSLRPGPTSENVRVECTLELFAIGKGSATMSFAQPEPKQTAQRDLIVMQRLSEAAVRDVIQSIQAIKSGDIASVDPGVLRSFQGIGELLNNGVTSVEWIMPRAVGRRRIAATFNSDVRDRIVAQPKERGRRRPIELDGVLEMADFKETDLKCIIHMADGYRATCAFPPDRADDVYAALRHVARIKGTALINTRTNRPEDIKLESVVVLDPLLVNAEDFFSGLTLEQLAKAQGVDPNYDLKSLGEVWPEGDDIDAFLADIYSRRA